METDEKQHDDKRHMDDPDAPTSAASPEDDEGLVPDLLKRAFAKGFRAVDWGQESAKAIATGILHSDTLEAAGTTFKAVRTEVVGVVGREIVRYLENLNLTDEAVKILTAISLEVKTEIRFIPNDKKLVSPSVKAAVTVKRHGRKGAEDGDEAAAPKKKKRGRRKKKAAPSE